MLRRFVPSTVNKNLTIYNRNLRLFSAIAAATSINLQRSPSSVRRRLNNSKNDDGFGGNDCDEEVDIDDFVADDEQSQQQQQQQDSNNSSSNRDVVFVQNATSMDYTLFNHYNNTNNEKNDHDQNSVSSSSNRNNKSSSTSLQKHSQTEQEASSSQVVAKIWPELLQMSAAVEASQQIVMTLEDEINRTRQVGDGLQTHRAVAISRNLGSMAPNETANSSSNILSNIDHSQNIVAQQMSVQDAAFCFAVLQSVVEQSDTRLDEKFITDVAYHVFSADLLPQHPQQQKQSQEESLAVTEQRNLFASATASTWKSLVSSGCTNDDYLLGVGLARSADLVDSMDVPSLLNLLHGLRKWDRTHFTLHEMEYHRQNSTSGAEDALTERSSSDFTAEDAFSKQYQKVSSLAKKSPSLASLLREANTTDANISNVIHPNLIDMITQGIERRLKTLIKDANREMRRLEREFENPSAATQEQQKQLLSGASSVYKNQKEQDEHTITLDLEEEGDNVKNNKNNNQQTSNHRSTTPNHKQLATFVPICRPNELLQIIGEICRMPNGVSDKTLWDDLTKYSEKYFEWGKQKARFDNFMEQRKQKQLELADPTSRNSLLLLDDDEEHGEATTMMNSNNKEDIHKKSKNKHSLFETERLLALLPPLVKPITAINDPLDAIATAKRNKENNFLVPVSNANDDEEGTSSNNVNNNSSLIPTYNLLSLVSNELALSAGKHVSIIGYRNPDLMRNLRRAFEEFPVLYETSPALWDVLRNTRISRKVGGMFGNRRNVSDTGLDKTAGKLGKLPRFIPRDESEWNKSRNSVGRGMQNAQRRITSKHWMIDAPEHLPVVMKKNKFDPHQFRHMKVGPRMRTLSTDIRINKAKDAKKKRKFSKGKYNATRMGEASHQS